MLHHLDHFYFCVPPDRHSFPCCHLVSTRSPPTSVTNSLVFFHSSLIPTGRPAVTANLRPSRAGDTTYGPRLLTAAHTTADRGGGPLYSGHTHPSCGSHNHRPPTHHTVLGPRASHADRRHQRSRPLSGPAGRVIPPTAHGFSRRPHTTADRGGGPLHSGHTYPSCCSHNHRPLPHHTVPGPRASHADRRHHSRSMGSTLTTTGQTVTLPQ